MDAIKKFFANFHKHGTISIRRIRKEKIIITNIEKTSSPQELKSTLEAETTALEPQQKEGTTTLDEVLEFPMSDLQDENTAAVLKTNDETSECLKEFDEIMQEINGDILIDQVSLDEIDDVLNIINEEENLKEESLHLEIPRFDLHDLIHRFDSCKRNVNGDDYMEIHEPNSLDLCNEPIIDLDLFDLENEINVPNSLEKHDKTTEESDVLKEKDSNVQEYDVISISSDGSQAADEYVKSNKKRTYEHKNVKNETEDINEPTNVNIGTNDVPRNVDSENKETNEAINIIDEIEQINNENGNLNNGSKDMNDVNFENEGTNEEPSNMDMENKGISESKQAKNENDGINNNNENDGLNDQATTYVTFIDGSDDDCGYHSSDFEFITEDEAKMDGLIIHIKPYMLKRKVKKTKRVKTIDITIDNFFEDNNKHSLIGNRPGPSNMQEDGPGITNFSPGPSSSLQANGLGLYNFSSGPRMQNDSGINNYSPGPSHLHRNGPVAKNVGHGPIMPVNGPGINNYGHNHLHGHGSGLNNFGHGLSSMQENGPRPSCLQGNVPDLSDPRIQRWRNYQLRKRLNRRQFVPDYGYREDHRIIDGEPYHQLFDPSFGPLPNHRSMGLLENKSTLSKNTMLVGYQGLGFDIHMLRECRGNEDENVKKDADESVKKILKMYPGENRKKRRRF